MKKLFYGMTLMLLISALILSGCTSTPNTPSTNSAVDNQQVTQKASSLDCAAIQKALSNTDRRFNCVMKNNYCDCSIEGVDFGFRAYSLDKYFFVCKDGREVKTAMDCTPAPNSRIYGIGDSLVAGDFTWKITDVTTATEIGQYYGNTFMGEKASGIFVILDVEVENTGKSAQYLSDSYIKLVDDQDREFSASTMAAIYLKPQGSALMFEQLNPGITKKGKVVYDVPTGLKVANVRITSSLFTTESYTVKINIP